MRYQQTNERRAVILMVVLSLLTLFALVGITFVLYADAEAASARVSREAETAQRADVPPEQALAFFLSQFIYGVNDDMSGVGSALRGHDLARTMYGNFYLGGGATFQSPIINNMANTTGLAVGQIVTVISNQNPQHFVNAVVSSVTPAAAGSPGSFTMAFPFPPSPPYVPLPWPYNNQPPMNGVIVKVDANDNAFNGVGRLHYTYPAGSLQNMDDYSLPNYTFFAADNFVRDPERYNLGGVRTNPLLPQQNAFVGGNAPYTYPDLNNCFLAAVTANGTILAPSFHRNYSGALPNLPTPFPGFGSLDPSNPNWYGTVTNPPPGWQPTWPSPAALKYMVMRPRPAEHPGFPPPEDAGGDVKNLIWGPGGTDPSGKRFNNDSIWLDLGAPIMTAPDGTQYKMLFAPLIIDLDGRINLNTAGNILAFNAAMSAANSTSPSWQTASGAHVSNQGWGPWEVNLAKVLYGDQAGWVNPTTQPMQPCLAAPPEWTNLFTGMSRVVPTPPNASPIMQPGVQTPATWNAFNLTAWLTPSVSGRYLQNSVPNLPPPYDASNPPTTWTPTSSASYLSGSSAPNGTFPHFYAPSDFNAMNETSYTAASSRPQMPGSAPNAAQSNPNPNSATNPFAQFQQGFANGGTSGTTNEDLNHPSLYNAFQLPSGTSVGTRAFRASDMESLLRPNNNFLAPFNQTSINPQPPDSGSSALLSDLMRLCPSNFGPSAAGAGNTYPRYRNLVTTLSTDLGVPGVSPYWWGNSAITPYYLTANTANYQLAPIGAAVPFPTSATPPNAPQQFSPITNNPAGTNPPISEFSSNWRAVSALTALYLPSTNPTQPLAPASLPNPGWTWNAAATPPQWSLVSATANPTQVAYTTPGARIRLNRSLPPYPHMGMGLNPSYTSQPPGNNPLAPYGVAYNLTNPMGANFNPVTLQYQAALNARQALANDIYRRLLAITGVQPPLAVAAPTSAELAPRRWLAQLAVNMVDYIDEDDINTPFNFYTTADGLPAASLNATQGNDDPTPTGANPIYWVFGTEMPKVVLNEVLAEALNPTTAATPVGGESVKVWVELFNTMSSTGGTNTQPQDTYRVPLYMTNPAAGAGAGYSPYRISIAQTMMNQPPPGAPAAAAGANNYMPDASANVLGKAYIGNANSPVPLPQSTTDVDFSAVVPLTPGSATATQAAFTVPGTGNTINAGVDAGNYFLIGPSSGLAAYQDPFAAGLPLNIPVLRTDNVTYTPTATSWPAANMNDERTTGVTVMLRRLANPYLPFNGNPTVPDPNNAGNFLPNPVYNPYITVDYVQNVPIQSNATPPAGVAYSSRGKTQPYAALTLLPTTNVSPSGTVATATSPVANQAPNASPPPPGAATHPAPNNLVYTTFGYANFPLPPSGHYDWLVHLDRAPISPLELLHVPAYQPYQLTQRFMLGSDAAAVNTTATPATLNMYGHYAPWLDALPTGQTLGTVSCPWWFDSALTSGVTATSQSHRLYRLFEFLECGDRAIGVNGLGRIPGKVNINTIWDPEVLQAVIDANPSMGLTSNLSQFPPSTSDAIALMFQNLVQSRSQNAQYNVTTGQYGGSIGAVNMGTGTDDRPFLPLSAGLTPSGAGTQYPNGISVTTDTLLRMNPLNANTTPAANTLLLFQNPGSTPGTVTPDSNTTPPYLQTQILTKLFNNVTTRSNTFAIFLTVGFFQVTDATTTPPTLGPEIGRNEGRQVRHRMFAIVDRTNLSVFTLSGTPGQTFPASATPPTTVTGPTVPAAGSNPPAPADNPTGTQTIILPLNVLGATPPAPAQPALYVPSSSGIPGIIQPGTQLVIDAGTALEETVTVISITQPPNPQPAPPAPPVPATFTANFALPHGSTISILRRGNPGPWMQFPTPYDPRSDPFVVRYFSIID